MIVYITGPHDLLPLEYVIHDQYYTDLVEWCEWAEKHPEVTEEEEPYVKLRRERR